MPDADGRLSDEDKNKITAWLSKFGQPVAKCPICGSQQWIIADHLTQPVTLGAAHVMNLFGPGIAYPTAAVVSQPCGYTMYVNAVTMGLIPAAETPSG